MDWTAALAPLLGVIVGSVLTWLLHRNVTARQFEYQRARDESDRAAAFWNDVLIGLRNALGELIALAIREMPERPQGWYGLSLDPEKWPKDWKMMHEEQDRLRATINRFALMSPYRSTVERAKVVIALIDKYASVETLFDVFDSSDPDEPLTDAQREEVRSRYESLRVEFREARENLLDAAYALQQHLVAFAARPESDPG